MKRRALLLLAAVAIALMGTGIVFSYASQSRAAGSAQEDEQPVLLATQLIPAGTTGQQILDANLLRLAQLPTRAVPVGALSDLVPVTALALNGDVQPGEMLFQGNFGDPQQLAGLQIPDDKVAISVQLGDSQRVAGFVQPGSEVAVFDTYAVEGPGSAPTDGEAPPAVDKATRLLLPRATVIATGGEAYGAVEAPAAQEDAAGTPENQPVENAAVVTLAVAVEDAQKLAHAAHTGEIYLSLLSPLSRSEVGPPVDNRNLFN